jgi:hypothetical protein
VKYRYRVGALLFLLAVITYLDRVSPLLALASGSTCVLVHSNGDGSSESLRLLMPYLKFQADGLPTASACGSS